MVWSSKTGNLAVDKGSSLALAWSTGQVACRKLGFYSSLFWITLCKALLCASVSLSMECDNETAKHLEIY